MSSNANKVQGFNKTSVSDENSGMDTCSNACTRGQFALPTHEKAVQAFQACDTQATPKSPREGEAYVAEKILCIPTFGVGINDETSDNVDTNESSVTTLRDESNSSHNSCGTKLPKTVAFRDQNSQTIHENSGINVSENVTEENPNHASESRKIDETMNAPKMENVNTRDEELNLSKTNSNSIYSDGAAISHGSRRPNVKRRMSSTIRRLQETIREAQIKDSGGSVENLQESLDANIATRGIVTTSAASSMAVRVRAIRDARRQRSKSRTRFGKMKYDEIQRPYRRWLGVSTCTCNSYDTRFILSRDQPQKVMRPVEEDDGFEDMNSPVTNGTRDAERQESKNCKSHEQLAENECGDNNYSHENVADHKNTPADKVYDHSVGCQVEDDALVAHKSILPSPNKSRHRNSVRHIRFESPTTDNGELITEECLGDQFENLQQKAVQTKEQQEIDGNEFCPEERLTHDPLSLDSTIISGDVVSGASTPDDKLQQASERDHLPGHLSPSERPDWFSGRGSFQSPPSLPFCKESSDSGTVCRQKDGGLADRKASTRSVPEFIGPPTYKHPPAVSARKYGSLRHEGNKTALVKPKKSALKKLIAKFRGLHEKAHYITVRAVVDSDGKLPGQLKFNKGQIIKQLVTGDLTRVGCTSSGITTTTTTTTGTTTTTTTATSSAAAATADTDSLQYGYYRVGKLRRKVDGIFPSSHVTSNFDVSDSDKDDDSNDNDNGSSPANDIKRNTGRETRRKKKKK